jgi:hypothetical protein
MSGAEGNSVELESDEIDMNDPERSTITSDCQSQYKLASMH